MAREALSARLDRESLPPGVSEAHLEGHLSSCAGCRQWVADAEAAGAEWRLGPAPVVPDLTDRALETLEVGSSHRRHLVRGVARLALMLVAVAELAVTVPVLVLGHDREAPLHVAHEMGSFGLAVAVGLLLAAARPRLASGMAWLVSAAATSLMMTAGLDLARGITTWSDEAPHLLVVAAAILLWALSRMEPQTIGTAPEAEPAGGGLPFGSGRVRLSVVRRGGVRPGGALAREERRAS